MTSTTAHNTYPYAYQSYNNSYENTRKPSYIPPVTYNIQQPMNYHQQPQMPSNNTYFYHQPTYPMIHAPLMSDKRLMSMLSTFALESEKDKRCHMLVNDGNLSERTSLRIPNGTCITNPITNQSYVLQSYLTDTLQGGMYCGLYWTSDIYQRYVNHTLFELFLDAPQLAIKMCDEKHVRQGTNIENHVVLENAEEEWKMNSDIYEYAAKLQAFQPWLPPPKLNFATPIGSWKDSTLKCSWMITELANLGEFIEIVKYLHPIMYPDHHRFLDTLKMFGTTTDVDDKTSNYNIFLQNNKAFCTNVLCTPMTGTNFYIELVRCIMQQLCQSTAVMHSYNTAHLDLSIENIVLQFDPKSEHPLLCKVIDFGRAHNFKEDNNNCGCDEVIEDGGSDEEMDRFHVWAKKLDQINFAFHKHPGKTKYMSPQATMFLLNEENAFPFNACKNDIWSLGCIMFSLLTSCTMYNIATYVDSNGYLNGSRSQTLFNADKHPIDPSIQLLVNNGLEDVLQQRAASGYCNKQCIDFMNKCFIIAEDERPNIFELMQHPFLCQKPDEQLLKLAVNEIQNYAVHKSTTYVKEQIQNMRKSQQFAVNNRQRQQIIQRNVKSATNVSGMQLKMWEALVNQENVHISKVLKDNTIQGLEQMIENLNCEHFHFLWSEYHCFPQTPQMAAHQQLQFNQQLNCQSYMDRRTAVESAHKKPLIPPKIDISAVPLTVKHKKKSVRFQVGFEHRHSAASISPPPSSCFLLSPQCSYHSHANLTPAVNNHGGYASSHSNFDGQ